MQPLKFKPIIKRALWGGTRLQEFLGKETHNISDAAESWEISDVTGFPSVVATGEFAGKSLRDLMTDHRAMLLGRHARCEQFPLLVKFLDAQQQLSVQVHPANRIDAQTGQRLSGKAESWIVLESNPNSRMSLGLKAGVTPSQLREAIANNSFEECLHIYHPEPGDCLYLPPGTVHALGGGLLIAEIQQTCDTTYRLHDWGRVDAQGRPRALHLEQGLACTDYNAGPVLPRIATPLPGRRGSEELVANDYFIIHRHHGGDPLTVVEDDCPHLFVLLEGTVTCGAEQLQRGESLLLPAKRSHSLLELSQDAILLEAFLPEAFDGV